MNHQTPAVTIESCPILKQHQGSSLRLLPCRAVMVENADVMIDTGELIRFPAFLWNSLQAR
ncbi:hypothetical protein F1728_17940 [Gimesia benthica]|uniref:Uncharacterized protein n=1 Tax=Gimesia benthica TaxID=2608982 RepID=A0A6I6ADR3_9PLAN|nr:hypothetical protein [Gimesia benthica]QGQ24457.1 hypothetical protein F1728_17940 [Gimesia benthica]